MNYSLPANVSFFKKKKSLKFTQKIAGYVLRMSLQPRNYENRFFTKIIYRLAQVWLSCSIRKICHIVTSTNVGFSNLEHFKNALLIGYFQSYKWASKQDIYETLMKIQPTESSKDLLILKSLSQEENPLVVHVRLGDYKAEKDFGILDIDYYRGAIKEHFSRQNYNKIWLFSDELEEAIKVIPVEFQSAVRLIDEVSDSPVQTLEAMRYGHGYVIANSTFSWWGAYLSYTRNALVIAPSPWFQGMESPIDLLPESWIQRSVRVME